ncbi:MAG: hypothetical protein GXY84_07540 [Clostridiales bacterium]|nr:hypothetical protein [Clostridiales bacterium]
MKKAALIALLLALATGAVTLWGFAGARLEVSVNGARELPQSEYRARFERLRDQLAHEAVRGVVYGEALSGGAEDYKILEYTLTFRNRGLVRARMLEAVVRPQRGDILCYSQQEARGQDVNLSIDLPPGQQLTLTCYLLTRKDAHAVRDVQVSYYIWGNPFMLKVTYG